MKAVAWIFLAVVLIGGLVMAAKGASADTFMGLVFLGAGLLVTWMGAKYRKNPTYTDASGVQQTVSPAMIVVLFVLGIAMLIGGLYILAFGIGQ